MASITGGSSSDREYAPHMYMLVEGGNPKNDADYVFVGDTVVSGHDDEENKEYSMGVTALGVIVCEVSVYNPSQVIPVGISFESIPESVKKEMINEGLSQIATVSRHILLGALGVEVPQDVKPLDFEKVFSGSPEEQAAEQAKSEQWDAIEQQLRESLGIE